jgi:succinate dehydrogenase/fumarate reductase flavoprotein subunit
MHKLDRLEARFAGIGVNGETVRERFDCLRLSLETRNLIQVARQLATAALMREESRGGHFRLDFPERDDTKFLANIVLWNEGGQVRGELRPVPGLEAAEPPPGALAVAAAA